MSSGTPKPVEVYRQYCEHCDRTYEAADLVTYLTKERWHDGCEERMYERNHALHFALNVAVTQEDFDAEINDPLGGGLY